MAKLRTDRNDVTGPGQVWTMDGPFDETFYGKRLWALTADGRRSRLYGLMPGKGN